MKKERQPIYGRKWQLVFIIWRSVFFFWTNDTKIEIICWATCYFSSHKKWWSADSDKPDIVSKKLHKKPERFKNITKRIRKFAISRKMVYGSLIQGCKGGGNTVFFGGATERNLIW